MRGILNRRDRRIAILDLEASALGAGSYPIEIGLAVAEGASGRIANWSTLISPTEQWLESGRWSRQSAAVHGLELADVAMKGATAAAVCEWLNSALGADTIVASDAPRYDQDWLDTLFDGGGCKQAFGLHDIEVLTMDFDPDQHRQLKHLLRRSPAPHRAGPDALRLACALWEAHLGFPPQVRHYGSPFATKNTSGPAI